MYLRLPLRQVQITLDSPQGAVHVHPIFCLPDTVVGRILLCTYCSSLSLFHRRMDVIGASFFIDKRDLSSSSAVTNSASPTSKVIPLLCALFRRNDNML
jgi:hypothetical protein